MTHTISVWPTPVHRVAAVFAVLMALLLVGPRAQAARARSHHNVTRLHFRPGRSHLVVRGFLGGRRGDQYYTFSAKAGQRLRVDLIGTRQRPHEPFSGITAVYVITFPSGKKYGTWAYGGYDPFSGRLLETGMYRIKVYIDNMATNARQGWYRMILTRSR